MHCVDIDRPNILWFAVCTNNQQPIASELNAQLRIKIATDNDNPRWESKLYAVL